MKVHEMGALAGRVNAALLIGALWLLLSMVAAQALPAEATNESDQVRSGPTPYLWLDSEGQPLPFQNDAEITRFLANARMISRERVDVGVNAIYKVLLEHDGVRLHAAFRDVCVDKMRMQMADGRVHLYFRDDALFEVAAYRLSRLLDWGIVPPTVPRKIRRTEGSLQIWVEDSITERTRRQENRLPPDSIRWLFQAEGRRAFDYLIANSDRNQGNVLIDSKWRIWLIDHTRAFRRTTEVPDVKQVKRCDRKVYEKLRAVDDEVLKAELKGLLTNPEIKALLKRRELMIEHLQKRIDRLGEKVVLFSNPDSTHAR